VIVALHTKGGAPPVNVATMIGENTMSVSISGGHGVLAVCESSGWVYCRLARWPQRGRFIYRRRADAP
jgi:hypothetical protein